MGAWPPGGYACGMSKEKSPRAKGAPIEAPEGFDAKRFRVPGATFRTTCPACSKPHERKLEDEYYVRRRTGEPFTAACACVCRSCGHAWSVTVRIDVTLSVVSG